ncbi:hypothetical protein [Phocaeicola sp.]
MKIKMYFGILSVLPFAACTVYQVPVDKFAEQIENSHIEKRKIEVGSGGIVSWWAADSLYTNGMHTLKCYDKKGNSKEIEVTPGTVVRFTTNDGKHATYYFDSVIWGDTAVTGITSRILNTQKIISKNEIKKIEIDNSRKSGRYK